VAGAPAAPTDPAPVAGITLRERADGGLELIDHPGCLRVFASAFVVLGGLGAAVAARDASRTHDPQAWIATAICTGVAIGGVVAFGAAPRTTVCIDRTSRRVTIERRGLWRERHDHGFDAVRRVGLIEGTDSDGDPVVQPMLDIAGRGPVALSRLTQRDRAAVEALVERIRRALED
jgi:hypothetical protein